MNPLLRLVRLSKQPSTTSTIGDLVIRGHSERLVTLEDQDREPPQSPDAYPGESEEGYVLRLDRWVRSWKVPRETAIPRGVYPITWERSHRLRRHTIRLHDVPGFDGVLVHPGNTPADTEGCILVGMKQAGPGIMRSRDAVALLEGIVRPILQRGPDLIEVV